ncbi:BAG family molecular chaperone regulator 4-like [Andrographis paniculata]|uniref:BAG family molecular chaperone regulator 4-like n=1 Tax=Andrographis paniculata TaxID=175694 RepID=UPI0021E7B8A2|nr:BAG family molecular chaperone regulator 4-like [Andrographis paniculata]
MEAGSKPDRDSSIFNIKVTHGSSEHEVAVPSNSSFGDLKAVIAQKIGLKPKTHKLLFRGKEKEDGDDLQMAGVKDNSKVLIVEDTTCKQENAEEVKETSTVSRGGEAVAEVREEVDLLSEQVSALQAVVEGGTKVDDKDILYLTEMLMRQLLKLDGIDAEGEGRVWRKMEVRRIQSLVETMDILKLRNTNHSSDANNNVSVTTQWETFEAGDGGVTADSQIPSSMPTPEPSSYPMPIPSATPTPMRFPSPEPSSISTTMPSATPTPMEFPSHSTPSSIPVTVPSSTPSMSSSSTAKTQFSSPMPSSATKVTQDWEQFD